MSTNQTVQSDKADEANSIEADQMLDAMLRTDADALHARYIHNDGFSDAVMQRVAQLPPPATALAFNHWSKRRMLIVSAAGAIATGIALVGSSGGDLIIDAVMDLATFTITPSVLAIGGMLLVASVAAIFAATTER